MKNPFILVAPVALFTLFTLSHARAQGTAFSYQGRLIANSAPASGIYDLRFRLAADEQGNNLIAGPLLTNGVPVAVGLFTVTLNFGSDVFNGSNYWLQVDVKTNGASSYTTLTPLQALTPTPYAIFANTASNLSGTLAAAQLSGALPSAQLSGTYSGAVTFNNAANSFSGNGNGLSNVNASKLGGLAASNFWQTGGNLGTSPASGNFLGTADNQALEIKVNNVRALRIEPTSGGPNMISGSPFNSVLPGNLGGTIAGGGNLGHANSISGNYGTVGGGEQNISYDHATVGGGYQNTSSGLSATVGGGYQNTSSRDGAVVGGGQGNTSSGSYATVGGGYANSTSGAYSTVGGGYGNSSSYDYATIGGGFRNTSSNFYATVAGGFANAAGGLYSFAAGHRANALHTGAFVWADSTGPFADFASTGANQFLIRASGGVGIGKNNPATALDVNGTVTATAFSGSGSGPLEITVDGQRALRLEQNSSAYASGAPNVIGGSPYNQVSAGIVGGTIAGGGAVIYYFVSHPNKVTADFGTVGGGLDNTSSGYYATIGGGSHNTSSGTYATAGGGYQNTSAGDGATVGGGLFNNSIGDGAFVGGGGHNTSSNSYATVPGGFLNTAGANYSFAAGRRANALHDGVFVWGDSTDADIASTAPNQFLIRAGGGVGIGKNNPATALDVNGTVTASGGLRINNTNVWFKGDNEHGVGWYGSGRPFAGNSSIDGPVLFGFGGGALATEQFGSEKIALAWNGSGQVGIGTNSPHALLQVGNATCDGTTWANASDRNLKENFSPVNAAALLEKVAALPLSEWNYKQDAHTKHLGPMAQDFHAAFGLGADDKHIATVDADGVALAAIQGLNQKLVERESDLRAELKAKEARLQALEEKLSQLEAVLKQVGSLNKVNSL